MRFLLFFLFLPTLAIAAEPVSGPIEAHLIAVIDGDTIDVDATLWPGLTQHTRVRLAGIDAPELKGACEKERALATKAKTRLTQLLSKKVQLTQIHHGKYAGRVVAKVLTLKGVDVGAVLVEEGLARGYGGGRRGGWCG